MVYFENLFSCFDIINFFARKSLRDLVELRCDHQELCTENTFAVASIFCPPSANGIVDHICARRFLEINERLQCVRDDVPCGANKQKGSFCIENDIGGECRENDDGELYCHDKSDQCPKGSECALPQGATLMVPPQHPFYNIAPPDPAHPVLERHGECSFAFTCTPRELVCADKEGECYNNGVRGTCIAVASKQEKALDDCLEDADSGDNKRQQTCFSRFGYLCFFFIFF